MCHGHDLGPKGIPAPGTGTPRAHTHSSATNHLRRCMPSNIYATHGGQWFSSWCQLSCNDRPYSYSLQRWHRVCSVLVLLLPCHGTAALHNRHSRALVEAVKNLASKKKFNRTVF